jgi:hypothetical protein
MRGALVALLCTLAMTATAATPQHKVITLSIVNGTLADRSDTLRVQQDDDLELRWSSDKPVDLHLHGYDIEAKVTPEAPAVMAFKANIPGRFPIEAHGQGPGHHRALLYLEVRP